MSLDSEVADLLIECEELETSLKAYHYFETLRADAEGSVVSPSVEVSAFGALISAQISGMDEAVTDVRKRIFDIEAEPPTWRERNAAAVATDFSIASMDAVIQSLRTPILQLHDARRFPTDPEVLVQASHVGLQKLRSSSDTAVSHRADHVRARRKTEDMKTKSDPATAITTASLKAQMFNALAELRRLRRQVGDPTADLDRAIDALPIPRCPPTMPYLQRDPSPAASPATSPGALADAAAAPTTTTRPTQQASVPPTPTTVGAPAGVVSPTSATGGSLKHQAGTPLSQPADGGTPVAVAPSPRANPAAPHSAGPASPTAASSGPAAVATLASEYASASAVRGTHVSPTSSAPTAPVAPPQPPAGPLGGAADGPTGTAAGADSAPSEGSGDYSDDDGDGGGDAAHGDDAHGGDDPRSSYAASDE